jgi:hypothetical protein
MPDTVYRIPDNGHQIPDTGYRIPDAEYRIPPPSAKGVIELVKEKGDLGAASQRWQGATQHILYTPGDLTR